MTRRAHHCHATDCRSPCPPAHLMCAPCWRRVPPEMQTEVYRTVRLRDMRSVDATWAPWWRAQAHAIHHVAVTRGGDRVRGMADVLLTKELAFADQLEGKRA